MSEYAIMLMSFAGGVALFLLGMKMLTDGLKLAAGDTLRNLLAKYTSTPLKGVFSGILITAMVQSSSAVIFATIGFVNAGLMTLLQATYVIFGSNVGTTLTGWIVATVGFRLNLQLMALPLLAVGMALWLAKGTTKAGALGQALVGFSIFFLGIDVLKNTFEGLADTVPFDTLGAGFWGMALMFLIGILLTSVMQSSSAAIAVVITAVATGVVPIQAAAVLVIGADIGTTSTALFAVVGATANAKRAAMMHVLFNLLKGPVALPFVGVYLAGIFWVFGPDLSPAVTIALFHTTIKVTGLILLLPFAAKLTAMLEQRFTETEQQAGSTRYLDDNILATPSLAMSALIFELKRIGRKSRKLVTGTLKKKRDVAELRENDEVIHELSFLTGEYVQKMQRSDLEPESAEVLPNALRVLQYFSEARQHALESASIIQSGVELPADVAESFKILKGLMRSFLKKADSEKAGFSIDELAKLIQQLESTYESAKLTVLKAGSDGKIPISEMVVLHDIIRGYRRTWEQCFKAAMYMDGFNNLIDHEPGTGPPLMEPESVD
ncbi:phosphate:Na+ symporter [Cyclonatronum proteinivorum]|uniref:Phosphate:Na+ symporter n=1 Tax=Cyclonatronum proteinivorum TaxID=1457365 RepID=A0A345UIC0_9BACT|nr:Na/Pi symporter [Cyclonatronum proteinivorum]AXJ00222.1 phosphate:Na+ symporter [Cyclonatronum proteinivorum]